MDTPATVTVDSFYLDGLKAKALAWDQLQEELGEIHAARIQDDMDSSLSPNGKIDITRAVPFDQTIIVTNLPSTISGVELMYSFPAPGGIRCYKLFFEPGNGKGRLTALVTFATSDAAKNYLSYVSKYGVFFVSEKVIEGYLGPPRVGEYLRKSADGRFKFLLRSLPAVTINPWVGVERVIGNLINGDEGGYCDVAQAIRQGATRALLISPGMEAKLVHEELRHLVTTPDLKIELNRLLPAMPPREGKVTIIRFCSVRDAVMVKAYLSLLKAFSGSGGRTVEYCKDPMDCPTENLGWHELAVLQKTNEPLTNGVSNLVAINTTTKIAPPESGVPAAEYNAPCRPFDTTSDTDTEESDDESEMRELSFCLAKQAFLPHIPISPTRECFPTLCHTPAIGDQSPAQVEHELQPGTKAELEDRCMDGENSEPIFPKVHESIIPAITVEKLGLQFENAPNRLKYPHEIFLSQGRAARKRDAGALKKVHVGGVFGTSESPRGLKTAVSSPDLSWVKDTNGSFRGVETNDKRTTPSLGVPQLTPLLAHPPRSISPTPPIAKAVKSPLADHETTLEQYCKEKKELLSAATVSENLKTELAKTAKGPKFKQQALNTANLKQIHGVAKRIDISWKSPPTNNIPASDEDNLLGGWGDDF